MTKILHMTICAISLIAFAGCDIHEFPHEDSSRIPFSLDIRFETDMPQYAEITYTKSDVQTSVTESHDIRYIVNAYRIGPQRDDSREPDESFIFTKSVAGGLDNRVEVNLPEGEYEFKIWTDYIDSGYNTDKYYNTSDYSEIILADRNDHPGSNEYREAFRGYASGTVLNPERYPANMHSQIEQEVQVTMQRPMGKFIFISTDVEVFLTKMMEMMMEQSKTLTADPDITTKAGRDQVLQNMQFHKYRARFKYNMFMPCSFNMFTDKPADSWTGMSFFSDMELASENEMIMGFDYVFVNGSATTISISPEVYNEKEELISSTNPIEVPIVRNKLTVVKGEFLTTMATGGVSINPGWDGNDYNIEIH